MTSFFFRETPVKRKTYNDHITDFSLQIRRALWSSMKIKYGTFTVIMNLWLSVNGIARLWLPNFVIYQHFLKVWWSLHTSNMSVHLQFQSTKTNDQTYCKWRNVFFHIKNITLSGSFCISMQVLHEFYKRLIGVSAILIRQVSDNKSNTLDFDWFGRKRLTHGHHLIYGIHCDLVIRVCSWSVCVVCDDIYVCLVLWT